MPSAKFVSTLMCSKPFIQGQRFHAYVPMQSVYQSARPKITLTHWSRVTYICVNDLTNIGSDNGLAPGRRQAIIWTTAGILVIGLWEQTSAKS